MANELLLLVPHLGRPFSEEFVFGLFQKPNAVFGRSLEFLIPSWLFVDQFLRWFFQIVPKYDRQRDSQILKKFQFQKYDLVSVRSRQKWAVKNAEN